MDVDGKNIYPIKYNLMDLKYNYKYPSVEDLREKAKSKLPKFAFEYLDGGCNEDVNIKKNTDEIREIELFPKYLDNYNSADLKTELFGHTYDAPFGIAPVGLQGLMWPNSTEILAKAAVEHNIPFVLSTVTTSSIERIGEITNGKFWFQLYHPTEDKITDDLLKRAEKAGCEVLVILCDVPTFGFRKRDIKSGLSMPPKMTLKNILQVFGRPDWAINTLRYGIPSFKVLEPYMEKGMDMKQMGKFMDATFSGRLNEEKIKRLRKNWKGRIVLKGVATEHDAEMAIRLGLDGIIVSNHGGRQLDAGESSIKPLARIVKKYEGQIKIMMDSGIRGGTDIARTLANGAEFTFLGRSFMYGVGALGKKGGNHTIALIKIQLQQIMEQVGCKIPEDFKKHLVK